MKSSTLTEPKFKKDGLTIVDVDVHAHETPAALAPYCEMPWRKTLEHLSTVPARYLDIPGFAPSIGLWPSFPQSGGDRRTTVTSAAEMRQDLDDLGIDIAVLFPDHLLSHAALKQTDYAVALARAYNRWLVEEWLTEDNGLKGAIIAPHHDPEAAAAEIKRYAGHPHVVAVYLPTCCVDPLYGNRRYDPVFAAAQEAGLPVMLHSVTVVYPVFPFNLQGYETMFSTHLLAHPFALIANLVSMMETGVPERFPELKIAFTEGGIGWVPWIMLRMDKEYAERRREVPMLKDRPSKYVRRMFFSTQPIEEPEHPEHLRDIIDWIGWDRLMFSTDYPHWDFDHPREVFKFALTEEQKALVFRDNAKALYGLA